MNRLFSSIRKAGRVAGFTVVEATIVLSAAAVLSGAAAPVISGFVETARMSRAHTDLTVLGSAIQLFRYDTAESGFRQKGALNNSQTPDNSGAVKMLVSNGDVPKTGPSGDAEWIAPFDGRTVDSFQNHLITNEPEYMTSEGRTTGFAQPSQGKYNAPFAWRGPYINSPVNADPWGNRYASNVIYLSYATGYDVVLLSAGPDKLIDSTFTKDGLVAGGDDLIFTISGGR